MQFQSDEWQTYIASKMTQICYCLKIEKSGTSCFLTDHDREFVFLNDKYLPDEFLDIPSVKFALNLQDDAFELSTNIGEKLLSYDLLNSGFLNQAEFYLYQVNWADADVFSLLKKGIIGDVSIQAEKLKIKMHGIAKPLNNSHGRLLQEKCDAQFGDNRCRIDANAAAYNIAGHVSQLQTDSKFEIELPAGVSDEFFEQASLNWLSGDNVLSDVEKTRLVAYKKISATTHLVTLLQPVKKPIALMDAVNISVGCDKSYATCVAKFNNGIEFRGFAQMPGKDFKFAYPQRSLIEE